MSGKSIEQLSDWTVWEQMLAVIREQVTRTGFLTWFQPVENAVINHQLHTIRLGSQDDMVNSVLNNRYLELIEQAAAGVLGEPYRAIIEMDYMGAYSDKGDKHGLKEYGVTTGEEEPADISLQETIDADHDPQLMPQYTFDNFVVGAKNKLAHGIAWQVVKAPSLAFNPLFIYSNSGLGKTHLMHAIGNYVTLQYPQKKTLYVSSEEFTSDLVEALQSSDKSKLRACKRKYRCVDVLLIDDIQFLEGKESTQEEFFHVFNELYNKGKQIVICSDKEPAALTELEDRLRSRFQWNMVVGIEEPDFETRVAILESKARDNNVQMNEQTLMALELVAEHIENIRELEGALARLIGFSVVLDRDITPELVRETLTDIVKPEKRKITAADIKQAVARKYGIRPADLESAKRSKEVVLPRHIAMYLCREIADMSYKQIGKEFGKRNHTTVMSACEKMANELQVDEELQQAIDEIKNEYCL